MISIVVMIVFLKSLFIDKDMYFEIWDLYFLWIWVLWDCITIWITYLIIIKQLIK